MNAVREICRGSLLLLMKPLVRLCLRHSIKVRELMEFLKNTYISVARDELESRHLPVTPSKISLMTGIQRREVSRFMSQPVPVTADRDVITRVIGLWESGRKYRDRSGRPKTLSFSGREGDFADLVAQVSTDLNPYTVAFELERIGNVKQVRGGMKLLKSGYEPTGDLEQSLRLLAEDSEILHAAVSENIFEPQPVKNIHVKTAFDNIPPHFEVQIREWFLNNGGEFHQRARQYLSSLDRDLNPEIAEQFPDSARISAAVTMVSLTACAGESQPEPDLPRDD